VEKLGMKNCPKCGVELQNPPTGRPKTYCGQVCRRLVEFEIRRLTRNLEALDAQRIHLEQPGVAAARMRDVYGRSHEKQLADVQHSIETIENRLRVLLGGESDGRELFLNLLTPGEKKVINDGK
jgi:hypothetical protein